MNKNWTVNDADRRELDYIKGYLPDRMFDIHAHIYRCNDIGLPEGHLVREGPSEVTVQVWRRHIGELVGDTRLIGGLHIPYPTYNCSIDRCNGYVTGQIENLPEGRGLLIVSPQSDPDDIAELLKTPGIAGFKPYHVFSAEKPTFQAKISGFLPEWALEMANRHKLVITLHIVRDMALADCENLRELREMCMKYPYAKFILAHAARGFQPRNTIEGLKSIRELKNVWFDSSAVCEPDAMKAVLYEFGPKRLMWGSDFPVSHMRGRCVSTGDGFIWLDTDIVKWENVSPVCNPVLVGIESLKALLTAADDIGLDCRDLQDIFCDNAMRLLELVNEKKQTTQDMYRHAKGIMPGGTQLLSKRPEMMAPDQWPAYFSEARGCEVWDMDGKHYYDMSTNGIGACLLGFRDPDVTKAVKRRINLGSMSTLNPPEEVELADLLCEIHPWAEQVRFTRTGGETAAVAVRIARATTDRSLVAICGYSGWQDWYLAANLGENDALRGHLLPGLDPVGVPAELRNTTVTFNYNSTEEYQAVLDRYGERLAAVVMEPCRKSDPNPGFLEFVKEGAHKCGALLVFDEITIGWRLCHGGSHLKLGVNPDIAFYAKALGNGHPMGAVIGTREAMEGANKSFISSTYWTESVGPAAALAALKKMKKTKVHEHVAHIGTLVMKSWKQSADRYGLPVETGNVYPCLAHFGFKHELSEQLRTLYTQLMLERGFIAGVSLYPTLCHNESIVEKYAEATEEVFGAIADAMDKDVVTALLKGPVAHSGFRRLI